MNAEERATHIGAQFRMLVANEIRQAEEDARHEALEQAAKICDDSMFMHPANVSSFQWTECIKTPVELAQAIRALKIPADVSAGLKQAQAKEFVKAPEEDFTKYIDEEQP